MGMENRVSVIIPTYNRAGLVVRAVQSVLAAIAPGDEIIVIDDGSTDNTGEVLRSFQNRIRYFRTENCGMNPARDLGIRQAKNPLIALLDSDDEWLPQKLYLQRTVMDAYPQVVFCFSDLLSKLPDGKIVHNVLNLWRNDPWVGFGDAKPSLAEILGPGTPFSSIADLPNGCTDFKVHTGNIYAALMEVYYVWASSILIRKGAAGDSLRFARGQHQICEDWECFARLAKAGPAAYLDCELSVQHVHNGPRLTDVKDIVQATERIKLLHHVWGSDECVLEKYAPRFHNVLKAQHLRRARVLIKEGRMAEAKEDLRVIGGGPWSYRLLTMLPSPLIKGLISVRRKLRGSRG